jgi:hypothetical protein
LACHPLAIGGKERIGKERKEKERKAKERTASNGRGREENESGIGAVAEVGCHLLDFQNRNSASGIIIIQKCKVLLY